MKKKCELIYEIELAGGPTRINDERFESALPSEQGNALIS